MERTITVQGIGKTRHTPDVTQIDITLKAEQALYEDVIALAQKKLAVLYRSLEEVGFAKEKVKTNDFNITTVTDTVRDESGAYRQVAKGFRALQRLRISFDFDMERLGNVLGALSRSLADPEYDVSFTVKDKTALMQAVLASAATDARAKAEILATASGVRLGDLLHIEYGSGDIAMRSPTCYKMRDAAPVALARSMDIVPEDIDLTETVVCTWAIG